MTAIKRFEDIEAWKKGRVFVSSIYGISQVGEFARDFALRNQIRKAVISVPSNIAEGFERSRPREFHQFLSIAKASCAEVRSDLYLACDLGYIGDQTLTQLIADGEEVGRLIGGFRADLERRHHLGRSALSTQHLALST
jgi:four helix bundle protein